VGRQIEFRIGELPPCQADPSLLKQVWINLLSNALKYSSKRQPAIIEVGCDTGSGKQTFWVRDNGTGFDGRQAERLFPAVERLPLPAEPDGAGLGLGVVQQIVERHGGRVWAEGRVGDGATFYFTLPRTAPRPIATAAAIVD